MPRLGDAIVVVLRAKVALVIFALMGCANTEPPSPQEQATLDAAVYEYQRCVYGRMSSLAPHARASYALSKAFRSLCRSEREAIDAALVEFSDDETETITADLDAWTMEQIRLALRRY